MGPRQRHIFVKDVYKRQGPARWTAAEPVSYTHLDVYKRQGVCCIQLPPDERERQEKYLKGYLDREARFDIFWGDLDQYAKELSGS